MARAWLLIAALAGGLLLALWSVTPPRPLPADAPVDLFSAGRAMTIVQEIARAPHPIGSPEARLVSDDLARRLMGMGAMVRLQGAPLDAAACARLAQQSKVAAPTCPVGTNIIARLPGRAPALPAILLMAHHDTVWGSPGAADDSMGVAAILETVRALRTGRPLERDLIVLLTDGEEMGLNGAKTFFASDAKNNVGMVLNLESRGAGGRALMFETSTGNGALVRAFGRAVPAPSSSGLSVFIYRLLPNSTDFTPALKAGMTGLNFAMADRAGLYHSPLATPDRIDAGSLQDLGQQVLAVTRALGNADALPRRGGDAAFSDLWGSRLVVYPPAVGWALIVVTVALAGFAGARASRAGALSGREVAFGLLAPVLLVLTGLPLFLVNRLSGAGSHANYYDRLAALPRLEWQTVAIGAAVLVLVASWARIGRWGGWLGLMALVVVLGVAIQLFAAPGGPMVHWPMLAAALAMALAAWLDPRLTRADALASVAALALLGVGQALGYSHLLFLFVGAGTPEVEVVTLLFVALLVWPLAHRLIPPRVAGIAALAGLVLAVGLASWVRFDPIAPTVPVYDNDKH